MEDEEGVENSDADAGDDESGQGHGDEELELVMQELAVVEAAHDD